ncbi:hypothetical protein HK098_001707 [Nowakowskiella sp. JEL0407]|nr:hypothetical protein HK098_001707 [Nowakowskiella sp. JEL0407]
MLLARPLISDIIEVDQLEVEAYATSTANPPIRSRVNPSRPSSSNSNFVQQLKTFPTTKQNTPVATTVQNSNSIFKNKKSQSNINPKGPNSLFRTDNLDFIIEDDEPDTAFQSIHRLDNEALKTWIYPLNYGTVREYQESIVSKALFSNTLVALPTGLGKTFIAAVVMYNYYRWFPEGKIIFMAPTKPLVNQQISACYGITGIPDEDTITLTGTINPQKRQEYWKTKRVFYVTPQSIQNDLKNEICPGSSIVLLVVDEAHRATGNHSYTEVVRYLVGADAQFRVLALTATPGSDLDSVQQVITNLRISNIELRTEESMDLQKYTHLRKKDVVVVNMSPEIQQLSKLYVEAANPFLQALVNHKAHYETDPTVLTRFKLITSREKFRKTARGQLADSLIAKLEGYFGVLMSLSSAYNLLIQHGIKTFAGAINNYIEECKANSSKARKDIINSNEFKRLKESMDSVLARKDFSSHPKFARLTGIVLEHFQNNKEESDQLRREGRHSEVTETRAMIFSQYRDSVDEITQHLNEHSPLIRVMPFIGQGKATGKGFTQKQQLEVIKKFQEGNYNVLVCTSIGEEGLDIGDVDLIVCFDSQSSPVRMLQRIGRTGRKREGRVVTLLSRGKEEEVYKKSHSQHKNVQNLLTNSKRKLNLFDKEKGRMFPRGIKPVEEQKVLEIKKVAERKKERRKTTKTNDSTAGLLTEIQQREFNRVYLGGLVSAYGDSLDFSPLDLSRHPHWQTSVHSSKSSRLTKAFVKCMDFLQIASQAEEYGEDLADNEEYGAKFSERMERILERESDLVVDEPVQRSVSKKNKRKRKIIEDDFEDQDFFEYPQIPPSPELLANNDFELEFSSPPKPKQTPTRKTAVLSSESESDESDDIDPTQSFHDLFSEPSEVKKRKRKAKGKEKVRDWSESLDEDIVILDDSVYTERNDAIIKDSYRVPSTNFNVPRSLQQIEQAELDYNAKQDNSYEGENFNDLGIDDLLGSDIDDAVFEINEGASAPQAGTSSQSFKPSQLVADYNPVLDDSNLSSPIKKGNNPFLMKLKAATKKSSEPISRKNYTTSLPFRLPTQTLSSNLQQNPAAEPLHTAVISSLQNTPMMKQLLWPHNPACSYLNVTRNLLLSGGVSNAFKDGGNADEISLNGFLKLLNHSATPQVQVEVNKSAPKEPMNLMKEALPDVNLSTDGLDIEALMDIDDINWDEIDPYFQPQTTKDDASLDLIDISLQEFETPRKAKLNVSFAENSIIVPETPFKTPDRKISHKVTPNQDSRTPTPILKKGRAKAIINSSPSQPDVEDDFELEFSPIQRNLKRNANTLLSSESDTIDTPSKGQYKRLTRKGIDVDDIDFDDIEFDDDDGDDSESNPLHTPRITRYKQPRKPPRERHTPILNRQKPRESKRTKRPPKEKIRHGNPFFQVEADEDSDENRRLSSDSPDGSDLDEDLKGFVVVDGDETPISEGPTQRQAFYGRSLLSPVNKSPLRGVVVKRKVKGYEDDEYEADGFVVADDEISFEN